MESYHSLSKNKRHEIHTMVSQYSLNKVESPSLDNVIDYYDNLMVQISSHNDNASVASVITIVNVPDAASVKHRIDSS